MPQSLSKILLHGVFSTKERRPFLRDLVIRRELHAYLGGILKQLDCDPICIGGVEDHVHILFGLSRTRTISEVIKEAKRSSSLWIKTRQAGMEDFGWQNGYGIFSLGFSLVEIVRSYIERQELHHKKVSFQDEFRQLLRRYGISYDEKYLWD
jgi:REP element-mobilizing transposase RayT